MDALNLDSVHLVGASMGGFIAQTIAISTKRIRSLTLIATSTGSRRVGNPEAGPLQPADESGRWWLTGRPPGDDARDLSDHRVQGYAFDEKLPA